MLHSEAQQLALSLMTEHGLVADGWTFRFSRGSTTLGLTTWPHGEDVGWINISRDFVSFNDEVKVREVILHEVAHALLPPEEGHGPNWQVKAVELGVPPFAYTSEARMIRRWIGLCPRGHVHMKHARRSNLACGPCCKLHNHGRYTDRFLLTWRENPEYGRTLAAATRAREETACTRCFLVHAPGQNDCE